MKRFFQSALVIVSIALLLHVQAAVTVKDAWVRATVPQQKATGAFMQLQSDSDVRIIKIESPIAGMAEIHEMKMDNDVMKMRPLDHLDLPAGQAVELKPGGFHVMLTGLHKPVKEGELIPLTLTTVSKKGKKETIQVNARVRALGGN